MKRGRKLHQSRPYSSVYSTHATDSNRYSVASNSDTYINANSGFDVNTVDTVLYGGVQRPRYDSNALLMLPAPLATQAAVNRLTSSTSTVVGDAARSSEEAYMSSDMGSASRLKLIPTPQSLEQQQSESQEILSPPAARYESQSPRSSLMQYPGDPYNPFRSSMSSPVTYEDPVSYSGDGDESPSTPVPPRLPGRGVRLTDSGPVPGPEGVRRVSRQSRRASQMPPQNRYSRPTSAYLPPGAAPPQPNYGAPNP